MANKNALYSGLLGEQLKLDMMVSPRAEEATRGKRQGGYHGGTEEDVNTPI